MFVRFLALVSPEGSTIYFMDSSNEAEPTVGGGLIVKTPLIVSQIWSSVSTIN